MWLLYLDESGEPGNRNERHFVLGGFAIFERHTFHLSRRCDELARRFAPEDPDSVEFHASPMFGGRGRWRRVPKADRLRVIDEILDLLCGKGSNVRIFAACVDKTLEHEDPVEKAFEHICLRFDQFLKRVYLKHNNPQRGVIVIDKTRHERRLQTLASGFRITGHRWGIMRNLAEVPLFADSKATRLLQIADIVAYVVWRRYESNEQAFVDRTRRLLPCFDQDGPALHGLIHVPNRSDCFCPACAAHRGENWRL